MSPLLHHECTRVPVTALYSQDSGPLLLIAEGPCLRIYNRVDHTCLISHHIFESQAIHGISTLSASHNGLYLIIWGGLLVRTANFTWQNCKNENAHKNCFEISDETLQLSNVVGAPDWILDVSCAPFPNGQPHPVRCVAVTAHNALLDIAIQHDNTEELTTISVSELTSSSRSILYSAHLRWESPDRVLVAAGTAFGEIIYWSWDQSRNSENRSRIHRVYLGHEGSIFGVQISKNLTKDNQVQRRLLASCSDDRTIRIWDVSNAVANENVSLLEGDLESERTRHTGFSNASFDTDVSNSECIAIGWGHTSRVWKLVFLDMYHHDEAKILKDVFIVSSGEDATSRTWKLSAKEDLTMAESATSTWELHLVGTVAQHSGKNIWSISTPATSSSLQRVISGGADSKITTFPLASSIPGDVKYFNPPTSLSNYDVTDISVLAQITHGETSQKQEANHRSSKQAEFFRAYAFLDDVSLVLTTNSGRIYLANLSSGKISKNEADDTAAISDVRLIDQSDDLSGYSVCAGEKSLGLVFIAGSKGSLYAYSKESSSLTKLHTVNGKIGEILLAPHQLRTGTNQLVSLITLVGQKFAQLLDIRFSRSDTPTVSQVITVPISEQITGLAITSMAHVETPDGSYVLVGFRRGSIATYRLPQQVGDVAVSSSAELYNINDSVHGKEAVTAMAWIPENKNSSSGYLVSTGRDGCIAAHFMNLVTNAVSLVHKLTLSIGPNVEGLYIHQSQLYVYGFSSKKFFLQNASTEEEIMSVETGGAHRSWSFQPGVLPATAEARLDHPEPIKEAATRLAWTRASTMHIHSQQGPNHDVVRSGGHGREIKTVATSPVTGSKIQRQLIATGAEDTDIKIFAYENYHLTCLRTLRKHTTGIQCLQWSPDGSYLFSSGGCEEFFVWKFTSLPTELGSIGVVCEAVWTPESEHSDLRIMAFDVAQRSDHAFIISMVFSNSMVKVYNYDSTQNKKWTKLAGGLYFTSCLTQCVFVDTLARDVPHTILTAGTDGHAVLWTLSDLSTLDLQLSYHSPRPIHGSSSKTLSYVNGRSPMIVSGGDDGSIAFFRTSSSGYKSGGVKWKSKPIIVVRAHASAVTACAVIERGKGIFVITSGNDQWVRLWEVIPKDLHGGIEPEKNEDSDWIEIKRLRRTKTSVADVSSMAILSSAAEKTSRVLICGVGMEVITINWDCASSSYESTLC